MMFEKIMAALKTERQYQVRRWGVRQPDGTFQELPHSKEDFLLYMQDYLSEAIRQISRSGDEQPALETIRKVVTLGIACFEQHGVPERELQAAVINGRDGLPA